MSGNSPTPSARSTLTPTPGMGCGAVCSGWSVKRWKRTIVAGLEEYRSIVGEGVLAELRLLGERLSSRRILNINSTRVGGGVAEILNRLVPLLQEVGVDARWDVIRGTQEFFDLTKRVHNALHGKHDIFSAQV